MPTNSQEADLPRDFLKNLIFPFLLKKKNQMKPALPEWDALPWNGRAAPPSPSASPGSNMFNGGRFKCSKTPLRNKM